MSGDFEPLISALENYVGGLEPEKRKALAKKIGQELRNRNAKRIMANIQPDGEAMPPRKKKRRLVDRAGKKRLSGKMFPRIGLTRSLKALSSPDGVEVGYGYNRFINRLALIHQEGRTVAIGRIGANTGGGSTKGALIMAAYPVRRLLEFTPEDVKAIEITLSDWLAE